jgi:hypothetical protein
MLVWQSNGERKRDTPQETRLWRGSIRRHRTWQPSQRARVALEYSMAILGALASSYLILWLGL